MVTQNDNDRRSLVLCLVLTRHGLQMMMLMGREAHAARLVEFVLRESDVVIIAVQSLHSTRHG